MAKQGEIDYLKNIGAGGIAHAIRKPFSDADCGPLLAEIAAVMSLLPPPPARLLDLGCGTGWTSAFFARRGYQVVGQDISEDMIRCANMIKDKEQLDNLEYVMCDFENMNFDCEFDCAVFFDSLHHSVNEEEAIRMVYKALKPGGVCITSEPGKGHERDPKAVEAVRKYNVTEKDMPPRKIIRLGKKAGFRKFRVFPHAKFLNGRLYRYQNANSLERFVSFIRNLVAVVLLLLGTRYDGIVLMIK